jgi:hypothetical protein
MRKTLNVHFTKIQQDLVTRKRFPPHNFGPH